MSLEIEFNHLSVITVSFRRTLDVERHCPIGAHVAHVDLGGVSAVPAHE